MEPASQARPPGRQRGVAWEDDEVRAAELRAARPSAPPQRPLPGASGQAQTATAARRERAQEAGGAQVAGPGASDAASGAKQGPQLRSDGAEAAGQSAAGRAGGAEGARGGGTAGPAGPGLVLTRELLEERGRDAARQRARAGGSGVLPPGFPAAAPDDAASVYSLRAHPLALASLAASSYAASTRAPSEAGSVGGTSTWCVGSAAHCKVKSAAMEYGRGYCLRTASHVQLMEGIACGTRTNLDVRPCMPALAVAFWSRQSCGS